MKRFLLLALAVLGLAATPAHSQTHAFTRFCEQGGVSATTSGLNSTNKMNGVIPSCTVSVYLTGTTTLAPIYAAATGTGSVAGVTISSGGTYSVCPTGVTFSGGGGTGAAGFPTCTGTAITGVSITAAGTGYTTPPTVAFTGGTGSGGAGTANLAQTLSNPFTAAALGTAAPGQWLFYAADGQAYDVVMSGGIAPLTYARPVTLTGLINAGGGGSAPTSGCGAVAGDNSSTNCGYNNRAGDTATIPADIQTFGANLLDTNSGTDNVAMGIWAGDQNTGSVNVFIGDSAGQNNTGTAQVFIGNSAGLSNEGGTVVAIGENAGSANPFIAGNHNFSSFSDFIGDNSGWQNSSISPAESRGRYLDCMGYDSCRNMKDNGDYIVGIGAFSANEESGNEIFAIGNAAGSGHSGNNIIAIGQGAGVGDPFNTGTPTAGNNWVAIGQGAGVGTGNEMIAIGDTALGARDHGGATQSGDNNIGIGHNALVANTTGSENIAIGDYAGAVGFTGITDGNANLTGSNNVWIGNNAGPNTTTQLSNTIALGYQAYNTASNQTVIGNSSITSLLLFGCPSGQTVYDDGSGTCYTPGSGGGITGSGTTGFLPKWTGSTAQGNSAIDDGVTTASTITSTEPIAVAAASLPSQMSMTYNAGHAPTVGSATTAAWAPDSSGHGTLSEAGAAYSRVCTAANGVCTGSGNTTSTALTTNTVPKANGANSIINSSISDNGTKVTFTEPGQFTGASNGAFEVTYNGTGAATPDANSVQFTVDGAVATPYKVSLPTSGPTSTNKYMNCSGIPCTWDSGTGGALTNITGAVVLTGCTLTAGQCVTTGSVASVTISSIPPGYTSLRIVATYNTSDISACDVAAQFNGDTGNHYVWQNLFAAGASPGSGGSGALVALAEVGSIPGTASGNNPGSFDLLIPNYTNTTFNKTTIANSNRWSSSTGHLIVNYDSRWESTAAITSVKLYSDAGGNFVAGSIFTIYGVQ